MPPGIKITKEEIRRAAFEIVRAVTKAIGCSVQTVMYHFGSVAESKKEVYIM